MILHLMLMVDCLLLLYCLILSRRLTIVAHAVGFDIGLLGIKRRPMISYEEYKHTVRTEPEKVGLTRTNPEYLKANPYEAGKESA